MRAGHPRALPGHWASVIRNCGAHLDFPNEDEMTFAALERANQEKGVTVYRPQEALVRLTGIEGPGLRIL
jgi:hypothetical protein